MSTIGFRFEDERPCSSQSKRSFLQKLNERHGTLISNLRLKKGEESPHRAGVRNERPYTSSFYASKISVTSSSTSSRGSELHGNVNELESDESDDDFEPPPTDIESLKYGELGMPFHHFTSSKERDGRRTLINGIQSFVLWKQSSSNLATTRPFCISPPCTPRSSHSMASSRASPSEMSDEQIEDWLERPEDAEDHRRRKFSGCSANSKQDSTDRNDARGTIDVIEEDHDETESPLSLETPRASMAYPISCDTGKEAQEENVVPEKRKDSATALSPDCVSEPGAMKNDTPNFLSLPDDLFQGITFFPEAQSAKEFRLSCIRIYDML
ncbi:hypothetical protein BKA66DRAFT_416940 [Pyrenochaeta sp. MPI-SDFR-AT-0127]|nr:hypothetical protein BKA66DRAFT_416940 [Pyrenochaeta sp. MPI-SDFR-AT-0127]